MEKKIPVIIDCDPGIDDSLALVVAFSLPELDVKAVTTVAGNVSIENVTNSARAVLGTIGVKSKIYKGAAGPLMALDVIDAATVHGATGLGGYSLAEEHWHPLEEMSALDGQRKILEESEEPVTIIAVGPLTNIAILLKAYPELKSKIKKFSIMGGGLYTGNHTPAAEFNILADPEAAHIVYSSGIPIIMAGLDVTHKARLYEKDLEEISGINNPAAKMMHKVIGFNLQAAKQYYDFVCMHDVCSVLVLLYPDMFKGEDLNVVVETTGRYTRGYTMADLRLRRRSKETNCHVLLDIDGERFLNEVLKAIKSYS